MTPTPPAPAPDRASQIKLLRRLVMEHGPRHWRSYLASYILMGVMAACVAASAYLIRHIVNETYLSRDLYAVFILCLTAVALFIARGFADYGQGLILSYAAIDITAANQKRVYDKLLRENLGYFADRPSAQIVAQFGYTTAAPAAAINLLIASAGREALSFLALAGVMLVQDPLMSLIGVLLGPLAFLTARKLRGRLQRIAVRGFDGQARLQEIVLDTLHGMRLIKAFGLENAMRERAARGVAAVRAADRDMQRVSRRAGPATDALGGCIIALIMLYGSYRVIATGATPGEFLSFLMAFLLAYDPGKRLARVPVDLTGSLTGVRLLYDFLDASPTEPDDEHKPALAVTAGRIEFANVGFWYRADEPVLKDLSFVAEAGKTTALVGHSGSGKSTVFNLLLHLYEAQSGAIRIDGQSVADVSRRSLRSQIAYVGQDAFLFRGTIGENIAVGRSGATQEDIVAAARAAYADDFITGFPQGYDTPVGEHGAQLSSGQRQRVAIARALLRNAPIVLLDEPTAALDTLSEREVNRALQELCAGRTTLVIAHRLHTTVDAHRIHVMDKGSIVETGEHEELLRKGDLYASLYRL